MWEYNRYIAAYQLAAQENNPDTILPLLEQMMEALTSPWNLAHLLCALWCIINYFIISLPESRFHSNSFHPGFPSRTLSDRHNTPHNILLQIHIP